MPNNTHRQTPPIWAQSGSSERRIQDTMYLPRLTVADGVWFKRILPALQRKVRAQSGAVRVEDIALRYRSGRLGIADALDAASELLAPLATAGAEVEHRGQWLIGDDDDDEDDDDEDDDDDEEERPARLSDEPDQDLLLSLRVVVDAADSDVGAAALHWVFLALGD